MGNNVPTSINSQRDINTLNPTVLNQCSKFTDKNIEVHELPGLESLN